jgi:two-component system cell cycle sensor histidine kinase PleC
MGHVRLITFTEDLPARALSELGAAEKAAWLIDVRSGCILAANSAGSDWLGLAGHYAPILLDAAMPALARLRALAAGQTADTASTEDLVFWGRSGAAHAVCRIKFIEDGRRVIAIVVASADARDAPATEPRAEIARPASDDGAKVRDIARRIRDGWMAAAPPARASNADRAPLSGSRHPTDAVSLAARAGLAHELKTPLSAIAAAAEIMKDERFGPLGGARYVGYASDIHDSARHALAIVDRMLADAGAAGPQLHLDFTQIDVREALLRVASQVAPLAEAAGLDLAVDLPDRLPHIVADATSLRQILFNLVTNAIKFTPSGGRVTVSAAHDGDGPLAITITDTGRGMAEAEIEQLSQPAPDFKFERGGNAGGLGLGIPLAQKLAAANGAALVFASKPGAGTAVSIVFQKDRIIPV